MKEVENGVFYLVHLKNTQETKLEKALTFRN